MLILGILITSYSIAQDSYNTRLNEVFETEYIQSLDENNIKTLEFELDHSYFILDDFEKNEYLPELFKRNFSTKEIIEEPISSSDLLNFNVLKYSYKKNYNNRTYYKLGNTGKTIVFYSIKEFTENYNLTK